MGLVVAILAGRLADLPLPEILALALDVGASCPVEGESGEAWNNPEDRAAGGWGALPFFVEPDLEGDEVTKSGDVTDGGGDLSVDDVDKVVAASVTSGARQTGTRSVFMSTADCRMGLEICNDLK